MRALAASAIALAGCALPAAEPREAPRLTAPEPTMWSELGDLDVEEARRVWRAIDVHVDDYEAKLAEIPPEHAPMMAATFLAEGGYECEVAESVDGCGHGEAELAEPTATSGIDDACLRRRIVPWALWQIRGGYRGADFTWLERIAALPLPERELHGVAIAWAWVYAPWKLEDLIVIVARTGDGSAADDGVSSQMARESLVHLAVEGVDAAFRVLFAGDLDYDLTHDELWTIAKGFDGDAVKFRRVRAETWTLYLDAITALRKTMPSEAARKLLDEAEQIVRGSDCRVAGVRGVSDLAHYAIDGPEDGEWNYMACFWISAQGARSAFLRDWIAPRGLRVLSRNASGRVVDTRDNETGFEMPWAEELADALAGCEARECRTPDGAVRFRLQLDTGGRLEEIERYDEPACR
jgi:hypothetical protein